MLMDQEMLIRRLSLPRFLFRSGVVALRGPGPYASGLATSLFQDSIEAFLRVLAETGKVNVGPQVSFDILVDKVSDSYGSVLDHKAALSRLNKARVAFKHHGISVSEEDAAHFRESARAFLSEIARDALGLDFARASLISTIGHRRTENRLRKAQEAVAAGDYRKAMECAAVGFHIYLNARSVHRARPGSHRYWGPLSSTFHSIDHRLRRSLTEFTDWVVSHLEELNQSVDLLSHDLDIMAYRRFLDLTPNVQVAMTGALSIVWGGSSNSQPSKEDTEFCIDFVVDSVLRIGASHTQQDAWSRLDSIGQVEVREDSVVRLYPRDDSEVIRSVSVGDYLTVVSGYIDQADGYIAILQDGEAAFVVTDHVRLSSGRLQ